MKKTIFVVGAGEYQTPLIKIAKKMNLRVITSDRNPNAIGFKFADKRYVVDIKKKKENLRIAKKENISAVLTSGSEFAVRTVGYIGTHLNLNTISYENSKLVTNKFLMREKMAKNKIPIPHYEKITTEKEAIFFAREFNFPIVVKAVDNAGNRGVSIVKSKEKIVEAVKNAHRYSNKSYILVEEYIDGTEHTIEGLSYKSKHSILGISDTIRNLPPYPVDLSLIYPTAHTKDVVNKIHSSVNNAIKALGLSIGETHSEVIIKNKQPYLLEVAARGGGMHIPTIIIPALTGINMNVESIKMSLGIENVNLTPKYERSVMLKFLIAPPGKLLDIKGLDKLESRDDIKFYYIDYKIGEIVRELKTGGDRAGYIIFDGETRQIVLKKEKEIENLIKWEVE